jgi:cell division septation protein DedD
MASGGKKGSAGERVLEGRHVIGLFLLMLLFSGVFFTLGYVMGRSQYESPVRAATTLHSSPDRDVLPKPEVTSKSTKKNPGSESPTDTAAPANSDWEFYHAGDSNKPEDHLKPAPPATSPNPTPAVAKGNTPPKPSNVSSKTSATSPLPPGGGYTLQVAALRKESDAMALATSLQKKKFPAFVLSPQADKYYRVQVGPYADLKAAENARKGLESAGFKAIVKR